MRNPFDKLFLWLDRRSLRQAQDKHAWSKGYVDWLSLVDYWCDKGWRTDPKGKILYYKWREN